MILRRSLSVLLLLATGLGLYNVYADNAEVLKLAEQTACGGSPCVRLLRSHRTPMAQNFEFQVAVQPVRVQEISCSRSYVLLGSFACERRGQPTLL